MINNILEQHISKFDISFSWDVQDEENWHLNWKDNFTPIKINNDLIIIPDWDNNSYNYDKIVKIKPGMAFGTGHHETTFLMLKHLINNISENDSVLDPNPTENFFAILDLTVFFSLVDLRSNIKTTVDKSCPPSLNDCCPGMISFCLEVTTDQSYSTQ